MENGINQDQFIQPMSHTNKGDNMRILDEGSDKKLDRVMLYLTEEEAKEMKDSLEFLLYKKHHHSHINSENFDKEITISIYKDSNLNSFNERSRNLIMKDE